MSTFLPRLLALLLLTFPLAAAAVVEAPDHVFYGNVSIYGAPADFGTVIEARTHPGGEVMARYVLGRDTRLGAQYALRIPMDTVDPRRPGYGRAGDPLRIFVGLQLAAETSVGLEGVAVRLDLDPQNAGAGPAVIIDDVSRFEGNAQAALINFPVRMNTTSNDIVTIEWSTANGSAAGGVACQPNVDYVTDSGVATIPAGSLTTSIPVLICGDTVVEPDETFIVNIDRVVNGVPSRIAITGTILDDDNVPTLTVSTARAAEPAAGSAPMTFRARLSRSSPVDVRFTYATQDMEALAGLDYLAGGQVVTIAAGEIEALVTVSILADATVEPPERLRLVLSNPDLLSMPQASVIGTIDDPGYDPLLTHEDDTIGGDGGITALVQPSAIALSPDADNVSVYVTSESGDRVLQFLREDGGNLVYQREYAASMPGFADVKLDGAHDVVISADGRHVYTAALTGNAVTVFSRDAVSGDLTFVQSQADAQVDPTAVGGTVRGLMGATALTLSPDNRHLYVAGSTGNSLAVFERDPTTGVLRFLEAEVDAIDDTTDAGPAPLALNRPADVLVSPDGANVYVAARFGDALLRFSRTIDTASADFGKVSFVSAHRDGQLGIDGLNGAFGLAISADGLHLYVVSEDDNAVVLFDRAAGDGALLRRQQWTKGDLGIPGLGGAQAISISSDGMEVFVAGFADNSVTSFARAGNGVLTVKQTQIDGDPGIENLAGPVAIAQSSEGRSVYVAANIDNAIVRFRRTSFPDTVFSDGFE